MQELVLFSWTIKINCVYLTNTEIDSSIQL